MEKALNALKEALREVNDISAALAVLRWDQSTHMPKKGGESRGRQIATLGRISHQKFTDDRIGALLESLEPYYQSLDKSHADYAFLRHVKREYKRATLVPGEFVERLYKNRAAAYQAWAIAKPASDFKKVEPFLNKTVELSREMAGFFGDSEHIADHLIGQSDFGMTAKSVSAVFADLRRELTPLVEAVCEKGYEKHPALKGHFDTQRQLDFGRMVIQRFGFDFDRGRQDQTLHPYMTRFAANDVRITTNIKANDVLDGLFSTLHECGHALYELGVDSQWDGTILGTGTSAGVHESQSRLWENIVGRSEGFWRYFYPTFQAFFANQVGKLPFDEFYRAVNHVERSLIRTEADELTYNLHVIIRFDLELALLEGSLTVADLPQAWRDRYRQDLGLEPPNDKLGVLQDVHWYDGIVGGMFQGYTIGNILSSQFYQAAENACPTISGEIASGEFSTLRNWLKDNLHHHGAALTAPEVIESATGKAMHIEPYMAYLTEKYSRIYDL